MRYGLVMFTGFDSRLLVDLAREADSAGWDGLFLWDAFLSDNAWLLLAATAVETQHLRLGTMLTAPSRRRPWQLASEVATLDRLSNGRAILTLGLGAAEDLGFARVGEATDRMLRAAMLDESIDVLRGLWSGQPFSYHGAHYHVENATFAPPPIQTPHVPIWVVGAWPRPKSMQRAVRCDGIVPVKMSPEGRALEVTATDVDLIAAIRAYVDEHRTPATPFDIVIEGHTSGHDPARDRATLEQLADVGVTWWLEGANVHYRQGGMDAVRRRIQQGPVLRNG